MSLAAQFRYSHVAPDGHRLTVWQDGATYLLKIERRDPLGNWYIVEELTAPLDSPRGQEITAEIAAEEAAKEPALTARIDRLLGGHRG